MVCHLVAGHGVAWHGVVVAWRAASCAVAWLEVLCSDVVEMVCRLVACLCLAVAVAASDGGGARDGRSFVLFVDGGFYHWRWVIGTSFVGGGVVSFGGGGGGGGDSSRGL
jgi:hypothetical protein